MTSPQPGTLDLSDRRLTSVPAEVWRNTSARVLNLFPQRINQHPCANRRAQGLASADRSQQQATCSARRTRQLAATENARRAGHNLIAGLPHSFARLTQLTDYLYLHDNRLQALSDSAFENFAHLRYLNLGDNPLRELPTSIGALAKLQELRLENVGLETLPDFIAKLTTLDELALRNNRLASLPDSFEKLRNLRHLDLRGNRLTRVPDVLRTVTSLHKLDLRWNNLERQPRWLNELSVRGCRVLLQLLWLACTSPRAKAPLCTTAKYFLTDNLLFW